MRSCSVRHQKSGMGDRRCKYANIFYPVCIVSYGIQICDHVLSAPILTKNICHTFSVDCSLQPVFKNIKEFYMNKTNPRLWFYPTWICVQLNVKSPFSEKSSMPWVRNNHVCLMADSSKEWMVTSCYCMPSHKICRLFRLVLYQFCTAVKRCLCSKSVKTENSTFGAYIVMEQMCLV